jgi:hypothetical protein
MSRIAGIWRRDDGFSILESVVALVIVFGTVLVLMRSLDGSIRVVTETRRQTAAAALASELLERARSLEWEHVGLTGQSNDADCPPAPPDTVAGVACVDWAAEFGVTVDVEGDYTFEGQKIVFANGPTFDPFLSFHDIILRDDTDFERYLFVTRVPDASGTAEAYRKITAIVQWVPPNGYRREVRQVTYASAFEEPPSPVIDGNVVFTGGSIEFTGYVGGTSGWLNAADQRPLLVGGTLASLPTARLRATTNYVSEAHIEVTNPRSEWVWDDGFRSNLDPTLFEIESDDDFATAATEAPAPIASFSLPRWNAPGATPLTPNYRVIGIEQSDPGSNDHTQVRDAVARAVDPSDDLPYASVEVDGPGLLQVGTVEYLGAILYPYPEVVLTYDFIPFAFGKATNGKALAYQATIDRFSTGAASRKIDVDFAMQAQTAAFFDDTVYRKYDGDFRGWVTVSLPSITGSIEAGEAALLPTLNTGQVGIQVWDPPTGKYTTLLAATPLSSFAGHVDIVTPDSPLVLSDTLAGFSGHPDLSYLVTVESLSVSGPISSVINPTGAIELAEVQIPPVVTGTIHYYVEDIQMGRVLFDYVLSFKLPSVTATAAYVNPDL